MQMCTQGEQLVSFPQNCTDDKLSTITTLGCAPMTGGLADDSELNHDCLYSVSSRPVLE